MAAPMSDLAGYRADAGTLGQDQGLSMQLRNIMTAKIPLLNAPGTVLENSLYYDINSSSITAVELQATFAKDRISFNNMQMGSSPSAYIPSVLFAGNPFWFVQLPDFVYTSENVTALDNEPLIFPQGWGFAAIETIIVYMGASSIAQIQIDNYTNFMVSMASAEIYSKRAKMFDGAGLLLNPATTNAIQALQAPKEGNHFLTRGGTVIPYTSTGDTDITWPADPGIGLAVVPLRLPWCSMAVLEKRLSLDCKLSTQPIQVVLHTKNLSDFVTISPSWAALIGSSYASSTIQLWQEELSDKSLSVRSELLAMPEFNVGYPFQYAQSIPFELTDNTADAANQSHRFTQNLTSIINADLTTFLFMVTWYGRNTPTSGQNNPMYGELLFDLELKLNGQRFFNFDGYSYPYVTLAKQLDNPNVPMYMSFDNESDIVSGDLIQARYKLVESNIYEFNNSRLRAIIAESHLQNTARFTNQTFQFSFNINRTVGYLGPYMATEEGAEKSSYRYASGFSTNTGYIIRMCYLYNGVYLVGGDGGTTKLITN